MNSSIRHFAQSCRPKGLWHFLLFPLGKIGEFSLLPSFCKPIFDNNKLRGKISQATLHDRYQLLPDYQLKGFDVWKTLIFSSLFKSEVCNLVLNCLPSSSAIVLSPKNIKNIENIIFEKHSEARQGSQRAEKRPRMAQAMN